MAAKLASQSTTDVYRAHCFRGHWVNETDKTRVFIQLSTVGRQTASRKWIRHRLITTCEAKSPCWDVLRDRDDGPLSLGSQGRSPSGSDYWAETQKKRSQAGKQPGEEGPHLVKTARLGPSQKMPLWLGYRGEGLELTSQAPICRGRDPQGPPGSLMECDLLPQIIQWHNSLNSGRGRGENKGKVKQPLWGGLGESESPPTWCH